VGNFNITHTHSHTLRTDHILVLPVFDGIILYTNDNISIYNMNNLSFVFDLIKNQLFAFCFKTEAYEKQHMLAYTRF
jgi:hypothetical protein